MRRHLVSAALAGVLLSGCSTGPASPAQLAGTQWHLVQLDSSDDAIGTVKPDDPAKYEMRLGTDGTAAFRLDCNRASGPWQTPGAGQIAFGAMAMTRAMCAPGSLDMRIARELGYVRTYLLEDGKLRLILMADGGSQLWAPQ